MGLSLNRGKTARLPKQVIYISINRLNLKSSQFYRREEYEKDHQGKLRGKI
jgi:hypothetical protein